MERQNTIEYLYLYIKPIDFDIQIPSAVSYGSWQNIVQVFKNGYNYSTILV